MSDEKHSVSFMENQSAKNLAVIAKLKKFNPTNVVRTANNDIENTENDVNKETSQENTTQKIEIKKIHDSQKPQIVKVDLVGSKVDITHTKFTQISSIISDTFEKNIAKKENLGSIVLRDILINASGNYLDETRESNFTRKAAYKLSIKWRSYVHEKGLYKVLHAVANYNPISLALCHKQLYFSPKLNDNVQNNDSQTLREEMQNDAQAILDEVDKECSKNTI